MNTELSIIDASIIAEINNEIALAESHADTAITHASRAGALLITVKESLNHGEWLPWCAENLSVSARQAQNYIRSAKGLPMPIRKLSNAKHVAYLEADDDDYFTDDKEQFARIVANAVAEQMAIERAKMRLEFEREKELAELAKGINADYESFKQNRDGLINVLFKMKSLHVGAYWLHLIELSKSESKAVEIFTDFSRESIESLECDKKSAVVITDIIHASLVATISLMNEIRDRKGYAALGYESFNDYAAKEHPDTDLEHLERYQQMPIYSEIVQSIKAFELAAEV
jgi:hypothetical protein